MQDAEPHISLKAKSPVWKISCENKISRLGKGGDNSITPARSASVVITSVKWKQTRFGMMLPSEKKEANAKINRYVVININLSRPLWVLSTVQRQVLGVKKKHCLLNGICCKTGGETLGLPGSIKRFLHVGVTQDWSRWMWKYRWQQDCTFNLSNWLPYTHMLRAIWITVTALAFQSSPQQISRASNFAGCWSTTQQFNSEQIEWDQKQGTGTK